jgi:DNA-binding CsgD family transcriptional regulator/ligand-binding sensor protein
MNHLDLALNWLKTIGKDNVQSFQDNFAASYDISMCLFALSGEAITVWSNESLLCNHLYNSNETRCLYDRKQCFQKMQKMGVIIIETCYMGVTSFYCPIYQDEKMVAAFWGGVVNLNDRDNKIDDRFFIPTMPEKQFFQITKLLDSILALTKNLVFADQEAKETTNNPLMKRFNLSKREFEVIEQINLGKRNREIADIFSISEKTVKCHVSNIFRKMQVKDRKQVILICKNLDDSKPV